jgi:hypothetical protein
VKINFTEIPSCNWPNRSNPNLKKVLISKLFMVQEYHEGENIRLTVNFIKQKNGKWKDGISWDQLQQIKSSVGYGNKCAVEVYPEDVNVVNVANMRHLFILPERPKFAWSKR